MSWTYTGAVNIVTPMNTSSSKMNQIGAKPVEWGGHPKIKYLRVEGVLDVRPTGKSTLYSDVNRGVLTKPVRLGPKLSVWPEHEVFAVNAAIAAGKTDEELRALVIGLMAARAALG